MSKSLEELLGEADELGQAGELEEAEERFLSLIELARAASDRRMEGCAMGELAFVQAQLDDHRGARKNFRAAAEILAAVPGAEWALVQHVYWLQARHARAEEEPEQAQAAYEAAARVMERIAPGSEEFSIHYGGILGEWAGWLDDEDETERAEELWSRCVAVLARVDTPSERAEMELAGALERHAAVLESLGRRDEAAQSLRRAREIYVRRGNADGLVDSLVSLARVLSESGHLDEARQLAQQAVSEADGVEDVAPAVRGNALMSHGRFLIFANNETAADELFVRAEALYKQQMATGDPHDWIERLQTVVAQRAALRVTRQDLSGAAVLMEELLTFLAPFVEADPANCLAWYIVPAGRLDGIYRKLGQPDRADALLRRAEAMAALVEA